MIICNGFKDDSYIEAVILATKLGRTIIPVVENFSELQLILKHARELRGAPAHRRAREARERGRRPLARVVRREVASSACSSPRSSSCSACCKEQGMEDCLQLVHCHPGSQLQDIRRVKDAVNELAHVYAELKLMGAGLQYIDIGGGPRRRLRRQPHQLRLVDELHDRRVRERRRLPHRQRLQCARRRAPGDRQRVGARDRGAPQPAGVQHARQLDARQVPRQRSVRPRTARAMQKRAAAGARPARRLPLDHGAPAGRVLPRRAAGARAGAADVQPRLPEPRGARPGRAPLLGHLRARSATLPAPASRCRRSSRASRRS